MSVVVVLFSGFASCGERISYKLALASGVKGSYMRGLESSQQYSMLPWSCREAASRLDLIQIVS
jgi:hypothetical protein